MSPLLRTATTLDGPFLLEIELQSFSNPTWDTESLLKYDCTVAEVDGRVVGFLISHETFPAIANAPAEREILNLAVAPDHRRAGIAIALLSRELNRGATHFLEVRESNVPARALYRKCGFVEIGRRAAYYDNPPESAIVMRLQKW